tara:strand:- start:240 stop:428 length:189 start_codon:yes stop_codon:yes gene_type:complete
LVFALYFIYGASMTKRLITLELSKMSKAQEQTVVMELLLMSQMWRKKVGSIIKIVKNRKGET